MQTETLIQFLVATALVTVIPGPNILLIVNDSIRYGTRNGFFTVLGVSAGMLPLFFLSLAGVSSLMVHSPWAFNAVRIIGCGYLVYLGATMIISAFDTPTGSNQSGSNQSGSNQSGSNQSGSNQAGSNQTFSSNNRFFIHGMLICITNPKGILFAGAFFPQFIERSAPVIPQVTILITGCLTVATFIGGLYAAFAGTTGNLMKSAKFSKYTSLISGGLLIFMGLGFLFFRI